MICKNCGAQIEDDALFCPVCGAKQDAENWPEPDNEQPMGMGIDNGLPEGLDPAPYARDNRPEDGLKYTAGLVQPGNASTGGGHREAAPRPRKKRGGRTVFVLLCAVIFVLICVITWEILDLISINRGGNDFKAPALKSEYVSESDTSSAVQPDAVVSATPDAASGTAGK